MKALELSLDMRAARASSKEALSNPHRTLIAPQSQEGTQISALTQAIKNAIIEELNPKL